MNASSMLDVDELTEMRSSSCCRTKFVTSLNRVRHRYLRHERDIHPVIPSRRDVDDPSCRSQRLAESVHIPLQLEVDDMTARALLHVLHASREDTLSLADNADVRTDPVDVAEDVGRHEDRLLLAKLRYQLERRPPPGRVEPRGRLVEYENLWVVHEGSGKAEPSGHPGRETGDFSG